MFQFDSGTTVVIVQRCSRNSWGTALQVASNEKGIIIRNANR
jgi:hypothetical protein